jgi:hypothetical protein
MTMTRSAVLACCLILIPISALAQSRAGKDTGKIDALSGTWTGALSMPSGPTTITLQLKFDGKRAVTGTLSGLPNPGDVKSGTFDPKTGALKLQLGRSDGPAVLITLEGTVARNTAAGKVSGEPGDGDFKLTRKP